MNGWAKRLNSSLEIVKTAGTILGWFGWKTAIVAALAGIGTAVWARISALPSPIVAVCALTVFVQAIYLIKVPAFYRLIKKARSDTEVSPEWVHVPVFYLSQAACLFANVQPTENATIPTGPSIPWFQTLQQAIAGGEIERIPDPQDQFHQDGGVYRPNVGTKVSRSELVKFAEKRNTRPRFLFPDERSRT